MLKNNFLFIYFVSLSSIAELLQIANQLPLKLDIIHDFISELQLHNHRCHGFFHFQLKI